MKILHVINNLNTGGAEKLLLEALPKYSEKGLVVDLLLLDGTEYPFLSELKKQSCCNIHVIGGGPLYNPLLSFKLIPFVRRYDIVHGHIFPTFYWLAFAKIFSFSKSKLIYTEHNTTNRRQQNKLYQTLDRKIYKLYDRIICISDEIKFILEKYTSVKCESLIVIENGVNIESIKKANPLDKTDISEYILDSDRLLIQVSAFRKQKDQKTLIKSMELLPDSIKLLLVGDGELREAAEKLVSDLSLEKRIFFLGVRTDVEKLLKTSDIVILSTHYEGLSLASIEAMASGRPFIASDVPGLHEIVNKAGILFPATNKALLAENVLKLLKNPKYYETVALKCQDRAECFNIDQMIERHITLYKKILKQ